MLTMSSDLAALFMLGLLGTGHCIGMCGPLVVALPGQSGRFSAHLVYHAGRIATYGLIGMSMGAAGSGLIRLAGWFGGDPLVWVARTQVAISLVAGGFLLLFGLSRLWLIGEPRWMSIAAPDRIPGWRSLFSRAGDRRLRDLFLMGLLLGGLPCGLSYAAFGRALASGGFVEGGAMVLAFGLGTVPALLAVGLGAGRLLQRYRAYSDPIAGMIMMAMAARLLLDVAVSV